MWTGVDAAERVEVEHSVQTVAAAVVQAAKRGVATVLGLAPQEYVATAMGPPAGGGASDSFALGRLALGAGQATAIAARRADLAAAWGWAVAAE